MAQRQPPVYLADTYVTRKGATQRPLLATPSRSLYSLQTPQLTRIDTSSRWGQAGTSTNIATERFDTPTTGALSALKEYFAESCGKSPTLKTPLADSQSFPPCTIQLTPATYMPEGIFSKYKTSPPEATATTAKQPITFNRAYVKSLRSASKASSPLEPNPSISHPLNSTMTKPGTTPTIFMRTSPLYDADISSTPTSAAYKPMPLKSANISSGLYVFDENAGDKTATPVGGSARMGLLARPALGDLTNTPKALLMKPLKKNLTSAVTESMQVTHQVPALTNRASAIGPASLALPSRNQPSNKLNASLAMPAPDSPFLAVNTHKSDSPIPIFHLSAKQISPARQQLFPASHEAPLLLSPTLTAPSPNVPPAMALPMPSPHLMVGLFPADFDAMPPTVPVSPSSSTATTVPVSPTASTPVLGSPLPFPSALETPPTSPTAPTSLPVTPMTLNSSLPDESLMSSPEKQHWLPVTVLLFTHFLAWAALNIALPVLAALAAAVFSLLPALITPTLLVLDVVIKGSVVGLVKLSTCLVSPFWAASKSWATPASTGARHAYSPTNHHHATSADINLGVSPTFDYAFNSPGRQRYLVQTPASSSVSAVAPRPVASLGLLLHQPMGPYRLTRPGLTPLTSVTFPASPRTAAAESSPMQTTPYDVQPSATWALNVPASPVIPRCIFSPLQVNANTETPPAVKAVWMSKAASLLSCILLWVCRHMVLPALAVVASVCFHTLLLTLATAYCTAKKILICHLPKGAKFVILYVTRALWAIARGWALVICYTLMGSPCAVVGTHQLSSWTERKQLLLQQVTHGAMAAEELLRTIQICHGLGASLPQDPIDIPPTTSHTSTSQARLHLEAEPGSMPQRDCILDFLFAIALVVCLAALRQPAMVIKQASLKPDRVHSTINQVRTKWLMANHQILHMRGH